MLQYGLNLPITEIKAAGDGTWEVQGYASTFGNVDLGGDVIMKDAFDRSLASDRKIKFLYAHDPAQVLGVPLSLKTDDHGLFGVFKISRTRLGEEVHTLLKDGALDSFSIGFFIEALDFDPETGVRILKDIELLETSVVAIPMNPDAVVTRVKAGYGRVLTTDQEAEAVLGSIKSFVDRCSDIASLRARDGRVPGAAFFERLTSVRAATDELLSIKGAKAEPAVAPPLPAEPAARTDLSTRLALRRARLQHAGILETSDVHDSRRGT